MRSKILNVVALCVFASAASAQSDVRQQLELAERDFQRATLEKGVEGWNSFFADSGAQLQNTSRIVRGHAAIKELMGEFLASKTDRLIWWPVSSEVSASGDMAYTFGASGVVSTDSTGALGIAGRGTYLTVWRREKGSWKVTADMGGQANPRALERSGDSTAVNTLRQLELKRSWAITNGNRAELERIYSYDFLGIAANGAVVDKEMLLPSLLAQSRGVRFRSDITSVSVAGETGMVKGILYAFGDDMSERQTSFLHVYVRRDGKWEFIRGITNPLKK